MSCKDSSVERFEPSQSPTNHSPLKLGDEENPIRLADGAGIEIGSTLCKELDDIVSGEVSLAIFRQFRQAAKIRMEKIEDQKDEKVEEKESEEEKENEEELGEEPVNIDERVSQMEERVKNLVALPRVEWNRIYVVWTKLEPFLSNGLDSDSLAEICRNSMKEVVGCV